MSVYGDRKIIRILGPWIIFYYYFMIYNKDLKMCVCSLLVSEIHVLSRLKDNNEKSEKSGKVEGDNYFDYFKICVLHVFIDCLNV